MAESGVARVYVRRMREWTLAVLALWLVVQNTVLLSFVPWVKRETVMGVLNALGTAAGVLLVLLGILVLGMYVGWVLSAGARRPIPVARDAEELEARHG